MPCKIIADDLSKVYQLSRVNSSLTMVRKLVGADGEQEPIRSESTKIALDGVSFEIHEGERVGFIGENGAGKSTLLQILADVSKQSSGNLDVEGRVHAILTLGLGLREDFTGRENLYLDGEVQGKTRSEIDGMIEEMIDFIDIGEFIEKPVRTYSSGMKARLTFASLIFVNPEILLIDEALGAGDHKFNAKASKVIKDLCSRGKIVIIVSHGLETIVDLCLRCIWLDHGKIIKDGDPVEVTEAYREWIRKRDDEEMHAKFSGQVACSSVDATCQLSQLEIGMGSSARGSVVTGEDVWIRAGWQLSRSVDKPDLKIRLERMDGLLVADQCLSEIPVDLTALNASNEIRLMMSPFLPRDGTYKLSVEFVEGQNSVASRSIVFKCIDDRQYKGGVPVLRSSMEVDIYPVLKHPVE